MSDIKLKLSSSTESELVSPRFQLWNAKVDVATKLQRDIFGRCAHQIVGYGSYWPDTSSYADFMLIAKEIDVLENVIRLAGWENIPSLLHIEESTPASNYAWRLCSRVVWPLAKQSRGFRTSFFWAFIPSATSGKTVPT